MTRSEKTYYLVFALYNASWSCVAAIYALFLLDRGLDLFEINLVLATFFIGSFLFEVPTGAVADLCGRKISFLLSCLVRAAAYALYYFAASVPAFLCAEMVDALGNALASGALDAWAVDGMRAEGSERRGDHFFARSRMLASAALVVGGCCGAYCAQVNLALPWLAGTGGFLFTFAVALVRMQRDHPPRQAAPGLAGAGRGWREAVAVSRAALHAQIGAGLRLVRRDPMLRAICALTFAGAFALMPFVQYWQPHMLARAGGATWVLGWVWALLSLAALFGSAVAARLAGKVRRGGLLAACAIVRALAVLLAAWSARFSPALAGMIAQSAAAGASEPLLAAWVNEHVGPAQRATVLSAHAMSFTAGGSLGLVALGYFARAYGIAAVWSVSAFVFALCAVACVALREAAPRLEAGCLAVDDVTADL